MVYRLVRSKMSILGDFASLNRSFTIADRVSARRRSWMHSPIRNDLQGKPAESRSGSAGGREGRGVWREWSNKGFGQNVQYGERLMNIGEIKKNASGQLIGSISTLATTMTIGMRPVLGSKPTAPKFDLVALNSARNWVVVGALFELTAKKTGECFLQGKIDDPTMDKPLYIAAFRREDESYAIAWQRPMRRRDEQLGASDYAPNDMFDGTGGAVEQAAPAGDGLGDSTAPTPRGRRGNAPPQDEAAAREMADA
jgi:uncharacterized protein (DUF736 family)